ncbi:divalent-cation tolerance protein CutA [Nonomuraea sp. bgisy101]|uniref:divalent-cation tolerance protein CutA n=1 Tax=Nonomuraea sp. bgisy101 TaxID=3413784 RepID=UPI003D75322B
MTDYLQVVSTASSQEEAVRLAWGATEARLAAGVQIMGPIRSIYWWGGKIQDAEEWRLVIKTTSDALPALESYIKANHGYEVPEIVATPIVAGSVEYLSWVRAVTTQDRS